MRVCLCISFFPPVVGGAERQAYRLASGLVRLGDEVTVVTRHLPACPAVETREGVRIYRAIHPGRRGVLFGLGYTLSVLAFFLRASPRFDVVQATGVHFGAYVACRLRHRLGFRVTVRPTGLGPNGDVELLARMPFWPVWRGGDAPTRRHVLATIQRADAFVTLNRGMTAELIAHGFPSQRIIQIPNGVPVMDESGDAAASRRFRDSLGLSDGPLIVYVGRLVRHKGLVDVVGILPSLMKQAPNLTLALLGDGPLRGELASLAERLGVSSQLRLLGEGDPTPLLQAADVFVLPTLGEGMSNALLEAMGAGLPCVATRVTGNTEVITSGETGLLVEPGNPGELVEAISRLLGDRDLCCQIGRNARRRIQAAHSVDIMTGAYRDLFARLVKGRTPREDVPVVPDS